MTASRIAFERLVIQFNLVGITLGVSEYGIVERGAVAQVS